MRSVFLTLLVLTVAGLHAASGDLTFEGTWKLNPQRSHFSHGELPKSLIITIGAWNSNGIRYESKNLVGDKTGGITFTATLDGADAPVAGTNSYDTVSVKRVDARTLHMEMKKSGRVVVDTTYRLAADGKSLTREGVARKSPGEPNNFREWFDRQ
jgi:hypothetical protein